MADQPEFSAEDEGIIRQRLEEFRKAADAHKMLQPGGGFGFDPGKDPLAREAVLRLMEENIERMLTAQGGQPPQPEDLKRMRQELRERVSAFYSGHSES